MPRVRVLDLSCLDLDFAPGARFAVIMECANNQGTVFESVVGAGQDRAEAIDRAELFLQRALVAVGLQR
jgi:hypothetical protein